MNDMQEVAFDTYIVQLHQCQTMAPVDFVMSRASADEDITNRAFRRLCRISKLFMACLGLPPDAQKEGE